MIIRVIGMCEEINIGSLPLTSRFQWDQHESLFNSSSVFGKAILNCSLTSHFDVKMQGL